MSDWITDRRPTAEDEDKNGEVYMLRFPDGRKSSGGRKDALVSAAHVGPGVPWRHTEIWKPQAPKPQPQPGEVWRYRNGKSGTVRANIPSGTSFPSTTYPIVSDLGKPGAFYAHYPDGRSCINDEDYDLVERLEAAPSPKPPLAVGQVWRRRDGRVIRIAKYDTKHLYGSTHPFITERDHSYTREGAWSANDTTESPYDLVGLITEAPAPKPPEPGATPQPRRFKSITRTVFSDGIHVLDAIDEDGAAWWLVTTDNPLEGGWKPLTPLPAREPSHVDSSS